jgi:periplasmic divalent cation tolerance protein
MDFIVVLVTAPDEDGAAKMAETLVEERFAACINIVRDIRSIYSWEGKIEDEREVLMVIKTKKELFEPLKKRIQEMHPYSVPEIIALPILVGSPDYLRWLGDVTV